MQNLLGELGNTCNSIVLPLDLEPDLLLERTRDSQQLPVTLKVTGKKMVQFLKVVIHRLCL